MDFLRISGCITFSGSVQGQVLSPPRLGARPDATARMPATPDTWEVAALVRSWRAPAPAGGAAHPYVSERGGRCQGDPHTFPAPADCTQPVFKPSVTQSHCTQEGSGPGDVDPSPDSSQGTAIAKVTVIATGLTHSNISYEILSCKKDMLDADLIADAPAGPVIIVNT